MFQSDGASAVLLMEEQAAKLMGYKPKVYLRYVLCYYNHKFLK